MPALAKVRPLSAIRGMVRVVPDWRRRSLGQDGAASCMAVCRPWARWTVVQLAVVVGVHGEGRRSTKVDRKIAAIILQRTK
jgi:hypothetical protein